MLEQLLEITAGRYPRGFANPYRCNRKKQYFIIESLSDLMGYIGHNKFKNCYMTIYSFGTYNDHVRDKRTAIIDTIPFDFDDENDPQTAQDDILKLMLWAEKYDIQCRYHYSGNKGFHAFIDIEPLELKYPQQTLKRFVNEMQKSAGFNTIDMVVPGDLDRVIRIPNTINSKTGRYCIPLNPVDIKYLDTVDIEMMAAEPSEFVAERCPLPVDSIVHEYLNYFDALIDHEVQEEIANRTDSKFGDIAINSARCRAYNDIMLRGAAKGERDYAVCGIIHRNRIHGKTVDEVREILTDFNKKCSPEMNESYIADKLRYHMNANYSPCTFLMNVSEECLKCERNNGVDRRASAP